jgi:hypothetical protein
MSKKITTSIPELLMFGVTRGMIGAGIGMLAARGLSRRTRKFIGLPLLITGAVSTIPFALHFLGGERKELGNGRNRAE